MSTVGALPFVCRLTRLAGRESCAAHNMHRTTQTHTTHNWVPSACSCTTGWRAGHLNLPPSPPWPHIPTGPDGLCSLSLPCSCNPRPRSLLYMQPFPTCTYTFSSMCIQLRFPRTPLPVVPHHLFPFLLSAQVVALGTATCDLLPATLTCTSSSFRTTCCIATGRTYRFSRSLSGAASDHPIHPPLCILTPRFLCANRACTSPRAVCQRLVLASPQSCESDPPGLQLPIMPLASFSFSFLPQRFLAGVSLLVYPRLD